MIGKALLPSDANVKASLPAPTDASAAPAPTQKTDAVTSTEPLPAVNSVPKAEVKEEAPPVTPRPLSPYPYVTLDPFTCLALLFFDSSIIHHDCSFHIVS